MNFRLFKTTCSDKGISPLPTRPARGSTTVARSWAERDAAEILRIDLDTAGIPYIAEGPDGPLFADFHSLLHSYVDFGPQRGHLETGHAVGPLGHPKLTAALYGRVRLNDLGSVMNQMPALTAPSTPDQNADSPRDWNRWGEKLVVLLGADPAA